MFGGALKFLIADPALKLWWSASSWIGPRHLTNLVQQQEAYGDTVFYFDSDAVNGCVALTIDDGLARHGAEGSMVGAVASLLRKHSAHATFFVCSKYLDGLESEAQSLVAEGHELGNHMVEDVNFLYPKMAAEEFEAALTGVTAAIERAAPGHRVRWFRAPQGLLTATMAEAVRRNGLRHALGDAYADDWALEDANFVASTILRQATHGSVIILHQPEVGYREHTLTTLRLVLEGLSERGMRAVTLSELDAISSAGGKEQERGGGVGGGVTPGGGGGGQPELL